MDDRATIQRFAVGELEQLTGRDLISSLERGGTLEIESSSGFRLLQLYGIGQRHPDVDLGFLPRFRFEPFFVTVLVEHRFGFDTATLRGKDRRRQAIVGSYLDQLWSQLKRRPQTCRWFRPNDRLQPADRSHRFL